MSRKTTLVLLLILTTCTLPAQDTIKYWTRALQTGLNFNQAAFSDNWRGGGTNSIAIGSFFNAKANYTDKSRITWDTDLQLSYGSIQNKDENLKKMADRIFFDSKVGYKIATSWNLFASTNFLSQFDAGFEYTIDSTGTEREHLISKFMSPGYLTHSIGIEYKPVSYFWVRFGTGTLRQTFVTDKNLHKYVPKNYGVEVGKTLRNEVAFQLTSSYDRDILPKTNLKVRAMALAPYEHVGRIVSRLDVIIAAKVNRFISLNISGIAINDLDQDQDVQFSQLLGLGIAYNFTEFK